MMLPDISKITIDNFQLPELKEKNIELEILRLDKIHPFISGNKWFKLKYHLENFKTSDYKGVMTFGGAWSNHILAVACACFLEKIKCIGIIRGEQPAEFSSTLKQSLNFGMEMQFISREFYREKNAEEFLQKIKTEYPGYYIIPEGGAGIDGEKGASEILDLVEKESYSHFICAIGTSTMFNGISKIIDEKQQVIGIPVLKGLKDLNHSVKNNFFYDYHFGGYAKSTNELFRFMNDFYLQTNIPTDFVYNGKLCFAVSDLINKKYFPSGSKLLIIHSGGLQGNASLPKGTLIF